jgi:hypothetical protein
MRRSLAASTMQPVRGAQVAVVDGRLDGMHGGLEVERLVVDGGHQQLVPYSSATRATASSGQRNTMR